MSSEIVQKENENVEEAKEVTDIKENCIQETTVDCALKVNSEELNGSSKELSESENKENEEPAAVDDKEDEEISLTSKKHAADEFLLSGKRHLLIGDFQAAADDLSTACGIYGDIYGEMAEECAETYFNYGCALLELSKKQINPVGFEEDVEDKSIQEENSSEEDENNVTNEEKATEVEEKPVNDISENGDDLNKETSNSDDDDDDDPHGNDVDPDEVNDLQLAWEMLDLAKTIYKTKNSEESTLILAEVLMKCGEVSIEDEKFGLAIEDMTESLMIRRLLLPEDSRIIAETLFQLGIAHELEGSCDKATDFLSEALCVLEQRIKNLENLTDDKANEEGVEIKAIIPEIRERINDIKERKRTAMEAIFAAVATAKTNSEAELFTVKPASDISHLVRKRPKQEETDGTPNKVLKLETTTDAQ